MDDRDGKTGHLFFSNHDWFGMWRSNQSIAVALSEKEPVLFIPFIDSLPRAIKYSEDREALLKWIRGTYRGCRKMNDRLTIYKPPPLIHFGHRVPKMIELHMALVGRMTRRASHPMGDGPRIVWSSYPFMYPLRKVFRDDILIYYVVDDERVLHSKARFRKIEDAEKKTAKDADLVVVASTALQSRFEGYGARTLLEYVGSPPLSLFESDNSNARMYEPIRSLPGKVIGFLGTFDISYVDATLLDRVAERYRDAHLVFVGPIKSKSAFDELARRPNVCHLGTVDHTMVPSVVRSFDVGILPFLKNEITVSADPIKMYYYLAADRPTVATQINEDMNRYTKIAAVCDSEASFVDAVGDCLAGESNEVRAKRRSFMENQTWTRVASRIRRFVRDEFSM